LDYISRCFRLYVIQVCVSRECSHTGFASVTTLSTWTNQILNQSSVKCVSTTWRAWDSSWEGLQSKNHATFKTSYWTVYRSHTNILNKPYSVTQCLSTFSNHLGDLLPHSQAYHKWSNTGGGNGLGTTLESLNGVHYCSKLTASLCKDIDSLYNSTLSPWLVDLQATTCQQCCRRNRLTLKAPHRLSSL